MMNSFKYAFQGIVSALKQERNMKIHFVMMGLVIIAGVYFKISIYEWLACLFCFALVISLEMVNTAIEATVDLITLEKHPKAKMAKDVAAGAVLFSAIISAIIGLLIFVPKL